MIPQVTAAALVAENKQRAAPASVDSIPTSANQEDHVSMAAHAARRLLPMAENLTQILGIELLAAGQGCDFHAPLRVERRRSSACVRCCARACRIWTRTGTWPLISPPQRNWCGRARSWPPPAFRCRRFGAEYSLSPFFFRMGRGLG